MPTYAQIEETDLEWPPEAFLDGPVPDGDELLQRTVAKVHKHSARSARLRVALFAAAIVTTCAILTGAGVLMGHLMEGPTIESYVTATDPTTGARLVATMTPTDDGTSMAVTVTGVPVGTACKLTFIGRNGTRMSDGSSWRVPQNAAQKPIETHVWMSESNLTEIEVTTSTGADLIAHLPS